MRFAAPTWIALALMTGCLRFGYDPVPRKLDGGMDSGVTRPDGSVSDPDAAADGGNDLDAGGTDAAGTDASGMDAAPALDASDVPGDGGGSGSGATDAGNMSDASMPDSGEPDGTIDPTDCPSPTPVVDPLWTEQCPDVPGVLFCDNFEDGNVRTKWSYTNHKRGSSSVGMEQVHAGSYALKGQSSGGTSTAQSHAARAVRALGYRKSGDLWARFYYFLPSTEIVTDKFSIAGISSDVDDSPTDDDCKARLSCSVMINADGMGLETGSQSRTFPTTFPIDEWVCVEMHVFIDGSMGPFELFLKGALVYSLPHGDTLPGLGYSTFTVGVDYTSFSQGPVTTYTDDVMLGTSRLGCD